MSELLPETMTKHLPVRLQKKPARRLKASEARWIKAVPQSSGHGSGTLQKRLWRLTSDYVRLRDWHKYGKRCVATGTLIERWQDGNAGHYLSYSVCRGMYKFYEGNIHLQSASSNSWGGMDIGYSFGEELKRRGIDPDVLRKDNFRTELKINDSMVIEKMKEILSKMKDLPEKPEYYARVISLLES